MTQAEFAQLLPEFSHVEAVTQTNYYIDTPTKAVKQHHASLRLRCFEDRAELTLKIPHTVGNFEYNQDLTLPMAAQLLATHVLPEGEIKQELQQVGIALQELGVWGQLTTVRRECQTEIGLLALDENRYNGQEDYELELEVQDAKQGKAAFRRYLQQRHLQFKFAKSKVARCALTL